MYRPKREDFTEADYVRAPVLGAGSATVFDRHELERVPMESVTPTAVSRAMVCLALTPVDTEFAGDGTQNVSGPIPP